MTIYDFILQSAVFLSLGFIILLAAAVMPRLGDNTDQSAKPRSFDRLVGKLRLNKVDSLINGFLGKILRRSKVAVMKVDNLITDRLNKLKKTNDNGKINNGLGDNL